jgi:hypothetical protein
VILWFNVLCYKLPIYTYVGKKRTARKDVWWGFIFVKGWE